MVLEAPVPVAPMGIFQQVICASDAVLGVENILTYFFAFQTQNFTLQSLETSLITLKFNTF
jgi:hypothetical protein